MDRLLLQRLVLIAVAIPVFGWLAVSLVGTRSQADGNAVLQRASRGPISPAELADGRDAFERSRRLSVDQTPAYQEALLLIGAGNEEEARAVLDELVADEPDNVDAWILLYALDPARADEILRRVRELNPWAADRLARERPGRP